MELRQLTTAPERQLFGRGLAEARATRGLAAREAARSRLGDAHLAFGYVYAIFAESDDPPEAMLGGFILHDLGTLPQSFPRPDLSHMPARYVLEGSELWSLSTGVGRMAGAAAAAITGLLQAEAVLVYPVIHPVDLTGRYTKFRFAKVGEPLVNPYGVATDGGEIRVQPMLLTGEALGAYVSFGLKAIFPDGGTPALDELDICAGRLRRPIPLDVRHVSGEASTTAPAPIRNRYENGPSA
jgi:hypothetical protein